jgi:hypothetical protein
MRIVVHGLSAVMRLVLFTIINTVRVFVQRVIERLGWSSADYDWLHKSTAIDVSTFTYLSGLLKVADFFLFSRLKFHLNINVKVD